MVTTSPAFVCETLSQHERSKSGRVYLGRIHPGNLGHGQAHPSLELRRGDPQCA
jgi:hypothetical protein